jgi:hypothetical protein
VRPTLATIGVGAVTVGFLVAIALASLDAWQWRDFGPLTEKVESGPGVVVTIDPATPYSRIALTSGVGGIIWATLVILPAAVAVRRFASSAPMRLLAYAVVGVLSAIVFSSFRTVHSGSPVSVFLSIGAAIGMLGLGVVTWVLPPNKSLERTREG